MKIIDILAEKERPDKFMYDSLIYTRKANGGYIDDEGDNLLEVIFDDYSNIYDEVEIIEEDKKIEKLDSLNTDYYAKEVYYERLSKEEITLDIQTLKHWINKIIDYLMEDKQ